MERRDVVAVATAAGCVGAYLGWRAAQRSRRTERAGPVCEVLEAAPDYRDPESWYANYVLDGGVARWAPPKYVDEQDRAAADVFFVHGTTALRGLGNASVAGGEGGDYARWKVARQASCFTHRCRVFAPKYRQARVANYHCFEAHAAPDGAPPIPCYQKRLFSQPVGERAFDVAYGDVAAALEVFLTQHRPRGRPWILAGHSQGAGHCSRWLREHAGRAEVADLVVALPLGIQHGPDSLVPPLRYAEGARDFGVVLAWNSVAEGRADTYAAGRARFGYVANVAVTRGPPLSMNPLTLCGGRHGALGTDGVVYADAVQSAAVEGGVTIVRAGAGLDFAALFPSPDGDLHLYDFELWWLNLRTTIAMRLDAFLAARA